MRRPSLSSVTTFAAVVGAVLFVLSQLEPRLLVTDTTTAGGDMGAHVWGPAYLRDHLLPNWRITGWTPDWYAGFPWLTFYFPVPSLLIVALDVILPYNIAFKLVTVSGLLALPAAAWAFGRLAGMRAPGPACLAAGTIPFLFDRSFTIYGGNIPSTLAGEFSFSISLALALVFLGVFARGLETGRNRALATGLLALTGVCHVIPVFFALGGAVLLVVLHAARLRMAHVRYVASVGVVAALLAAFWVLPFLLRLAYTNDMGWEKIETFRRTLLPGNLLWLYVLAGAGVTVSVILWRRVGVFLTLLAATSALAFMLVPQSRLWNARLLPFWMLCLYLLAGVAVAEVATALGRLTAGGLGERVAAAAVPIPAVVAAVTFVAVPLHVLPAWVPVETDDRSFIPDWVRWNYSGYERKASYQEYRHLIDTMTAVGETEGCGRAMWEYESELDQLGTPMALMLLPYWTDGCVGSMEGLFFESSATTPYHFLNQSELSARPSRAQRDLPYRELDVANGVKHLQLLGVRYYMAFSEGAKTQARANTDLRLVATSGPWPVRYQDGMRDRSWEVYEVAGSELVEPLEYEPVVMTGVGSDARSWLEASVEWYQDDTRWDVPLAASGPAAWRRVRGADPEPPPRRAVAPARVSGIEVDDDSISFDVDRVGSPVLVKTSYFPNWRVRGGRGVWRVTPNLMVVVPTARHVELHYAHTPVDAVAWALTLAGLAGLVVLWRRGPLAYPVPRAAGSPYPWLGPSRPEDEGDGDHDGDHDRDALPVEVPATAPAVPLPTAPRSADAGPGGERVGARAHGGDDPDDGDDPQSG